MTEQTRTKILQSTPTGIRKLDHKRLRAQLHRAAPPVDYDRYMRSKAWQIKRRKFLAHFNCQCALCGSKDHLHVHHLHYETLGNERVEDVLVCCRRCHFLAHKKGETGDGILATKGTSGVQLATASSKAQKVSDRCKSDGPKIQEARGERREARGER